MAGKMCLWCLYRTSVNSFTSALRLIDRYRPHSFFRKLWRYIDLYLRSNTGRSLLSRSQHAYINGKSVESAFHDMAGFSEANLPRVST